MLLGSVVLALMLAVPFVIACAAPAPGPTPTPPPEEEVFEWRMTDLIPEGLMWQTDHFIDRVEKMSNGRLLIDGFSGGELMDPEEQHLAIMEGTIEISRDCGVYCVDVIDIGHVEFGLPRAWDGPMELWTIFIRMGMLELVKEAYAEQGMKYLAVAAEPPYAMISKVPIRGIDDLKGVKCRGYGLTAEWLDSVGMATTYIPAAEIYTALATGIIDAAVYGGASDYLGMSLHEVADYYVHDPYMVNPNTTNMIVNMDAWNSLPADLQEILEVATWERFLWVDTDFYLGEYKYVEEMGLESIRWPAEDIAELNEAAMPFWDREAERSARCAKGVEIMKEWLRLKAG
jgi:TRAP-type mannitol/chloroaromatic compound transport system substrate-binding protein